jgi:hypothetical protein
MTKEKKKRFLFKLKEKNPITTVEQLEKFSFRSTKQQKFNSGIIKFTKFYFLNKI